MAVNGKVEKMKESPLKGLGKFFKELKAEIFRITWPTKKDAKKAIIAVVAFCAIYVVFVALMDYGYDNLFKVIFK